MTVPPIMTVGPTLSSNRSLAALLLLLMSWAFMALGPVAAQEAPPRGPLGVGPPAAERGIAALRPSAAKTAPAASSGVVDRAWAWILATQQRLNRDLVMAVKALKTDPVLATLTLGWLSFAYGVLHAAGPGHGKAVISAYVLANERTVRRGIMLSFLAALFQALSALLIVGILSVALKATSLTLKSAEAWIETVSWALVALVGVWLLYGQITALLAGRRRRAAANARVATTEGRHVHGPAHGHGQARVHVHVHDHAACCDSHHTDARHGDHQHHHHHGEPSRDGGHGHGSRAADAATAHDHGPHACCDHAHIPSPHELDGTWSWRKAVVLAASVGIRPCTGAILVLLFALSQGLVWAGVFATFAMAIGTAITVSALAALAVGSRELATRVAGGGDGRWAQWIGTGAGLVGSSLVLIMGVAFFMASLKAPGPF